jgi:hypothetical protein
MIAAVVGAVVMFVVLGYLSWKDKYGRGRTIGAVAATDTVVLHQRVMGTGARGPVGQDRLVAIDAVTGDEYARTTVIRGQLVGAQGDKVIYTFGSRVVLYDAHTLEGSPAPAGPSPVPTPTHFGALTDLGGDLLLLDTTTGNGRARASRLEKNSHSSQWSTELPWIGHDTKLVTQRSGNIVIVDTDGLAALDANRGYVVWVR